MGHSRVIWLSFSELIKVWASNFSLDFPKSEKYSWTPSDVSVDFSLIFSETALYSSTDLEQEIEITEVAEEKKAKEFITELNKIYSRFYHLQLTRINPNQ